MARADATWIGSDWRGDGPPARRTSTSGPMERRETSIQTRRPSGEIRGGKICLQGLSEKGDHTIMKVRENLRALQVGIIPGNGEGIVILRLAQPIKAPGSTRGRTRHGTVAEKSRPHHFRGRMKAAFVDDSGDNRLSRRSTIMGLAVLTAVFGMGTGVTPPVWSPEKWPAGGQARPGTILCFLRWSSRTRMWQSSLTKYQNGPYAVTVRSPCPGWAAS